MHQSLLKHTSLNVTAWISVWVGLGCGVWELNFQVRLMLLIWEPHVEKHFPDIISFLLGFPNVSFLLNMVIFLYTYFLRLNNLPLPLKTNGSQTFDYISVKKQIWRKLCVYLFGSKYMDDSYLSHNRYWKITGQNIFHAHYLLYKVGQTREPYNTVNWWWC